MKTINISWLMIFLFSLSISLSAQNTKFSRVKISIEDHPIAELASLGLDCEHGEYRKGFSFTSDFSSTEIDLIKNAGFSYEIIIEDVVQHYVDQNNREETITTTPRNNADCATGLTEYETPENYSMGSMGGYFTYEEMLEHLDSMATLYPNLIKAREAIGTTLTHEDRPIYWLKISDNPNVDENEPEMLYDAIHHAREPNSLSQLIFYMWYLLENYDSNPEVQYLVDNTELYFVPCINPDGYIYNQMTNPNGGGLWRKNKKDNDGDGIFDEDVDGVDLNRNYGYEWGFDDTGSSPNFGSQTYRGESPFSEPETQNVRDFCNAHEFKITLNNHTYGNVFIYPWGYSDALANPNFRDLAEQINKESNFHSGTGTETVGYVVNGYSDDWMYGENITKPAIYSFTPEVGPGFFGFWPPQSSIIEFNKSTMNLNLTAAHALLNYGVITDNSPTVLPTLDGQINFNLKRFGLSPGDLTVTLEGVSANVIAVGASQSFNLDEFENVDQSISYSLDASLLGGETVVFDFVLNNGQFEWRETITKMYGEEVALSSNDGNSIAGWDASAVSGNTWATTTNTFYSAPSSITDSPIGDYSDGEISFLTTTSSISLANALSGTLSFWCKWDIENDYDYTQVSISTDGINFIPQCGKYTNPGSFNQVADEPLYDDIQEEWVQEEINLSDYLGQNIWIRFSMVSDGGLVEDGFYFDDLEINVVYQGVVSTTSLDAENFLLYQNRPNPAKDYTIIEFSHENIDFENAQLHIYNTLGESIFVKELDESMQERIILDTQQWVSGMYFYQIVLRDQSTPTKRMEIVR